MSSISNSGSDSSGSVSEGGNCDGVRYAHRESVERGGRE